MGIIIKFSYAVVLKALFLFLITWDEYCVFNLDWVQMLKYLC